MIKPFKLVLNRQELTNYRVSGRCFVAEIMPVPGLIYICTIFVAWIKHLRKETEKPGTYDSKKVSPEGDIVNKIAVSEILMR